MGRVACWLVVGASSVSGCNPTVADYCAPGTPECTAADGGAREGATEAAGAEASACDGTKLPHDDPCVVSEAYGVFVSPAGSDGNPGTRSAPVATIGHGLDLAKAAGKRVYVCAGSFAEALVVGASRDGAGVYGALDCASWSYDASSRVVVRPAQPGYALELEGLQAGATFEDVEFDAEDAPAGAGASSVAVFANASKNILLERAVLVAGQGAEGAAGASPGASNWYGTPPGYAELNGATAADAGGAPATTCACPDRSKSTGGAAGGPLNIPAPSPGSPSYGDAGAGAGGSNAVVCGNGGSPTTTGADAPMNPSDTPSTSLGVSSVSGWTPGVGTAGADGAPGQGGGGGGNGRLSNGSGGGGACGGCGGEGGKAGQGGGASIALLSHDSGVNLVGCVLTSHVAGHGGAGGNGEAGEAGGSPGAPSGSGVGEGCAGGAGGAGAGGNGGQGGAGGVSLGIGYAGAPPTVDGEAVTQASSRAGITVGGAGAAGAGGSAGAAAASSTGPAGAPGASGASGFAAAVGALP